MKLYAICLINLLIVPLFPGLMVVIDIELPSGWRNPNREEITNKWRPEGSGPYLVVKEDFNGDGKVDEARILEKGDVLKILSF